MSLLADLLSKITQPQSKREVPPNLKNIVQNSAKQSSYRKKIIILSVSFVAFVAGGILFVSFLKSLTNDLVSNKSAPSPGMALKANDRMQLTGEKPSPEVKTPARTREETKNRTILHTAPLPETGEKPENTLLRRKPSAIKAAVVKVQKKETPSPASKKSSNIAAAMNETEKAKGETPALHTTSPSQVESSDASQTDVYLYSARTYEMHNDYSHALASYKKALDTDKNNIAILNNIAYIYLQLGIIEDSVKYAQRALDVNEDYVPALINLGIAHARSGNGPEAEENLKRAVTLEPDNQGAFFNLALLHEQSENYSEAFRSYSQLAKLGNVRGSLGLARIYEKQNKTEEALQLYKKVYALDSADEDTKLQARQRIHVLLNAKR